jgi:putative hydrolase of the HAD superfamily
MSGVLPKSVLFDLDDTIIHHENPSVTWRRIAERYGPLAGVSDSGAFFDAIEERRAWYWGDRERHRIGRLNPVRATRDTVNYVLRAFRAESNSFAAEITDAYMEQRKNAERLSPGAKETVERLRTEGVKVALITNGGAVSQRDKIDRHGLEPLFDAIVIEGEVGLGKPDPRVYQFALDKIGSAPRDAWIVGNDLQWEVAAPQRLGFYTVWVDLEGKGLPENPPAQPDRIVVTLPELFG